MKKINWKLSSVNWRPVCFSLIVWKHYNEFIVSVMASQITIITIVCSMVYSNSGQRKRQSFASLVFVKEIHRWPVNSPHKGPITRKVSPFDDVIIAYSLPVQWWSADGCGSVHGRCVCGRCIESFAVPRTALRAGICLPLRGMCKGTVNGLWKTVGIPTDNASPQCFTNEGNPTWKRFPYYWPFVRGIPPPPPPKKAMLALMFPWVLVWTNGWTNSPAIGGLRCHNGHCDISVMVAVPGICTPCLRTSFQSNTWLASSFAIWG